MFTPDDDLYSIGAVGILDPSDEIDTVSDESPWVLQYTAWSENFDLAPANRQPAQA